MKLKTSNFKKSYHFEASKDIMTKFKSQAVHWKASGSGNPSSFIPALLKMAILGLKTKFSILFCTRLYMIHKAQIQDELTAVQNIHLTYSWHFLKKSYLSFLSRLGSYLKPIETRMEHWVLKKEKKLKKWSTLHTTDLRWLNLRKFGSNLQKWVPNRATMVDFWQARMP